MPEGRVNESLDEDAVSLCHYGSGGSGHEFGFRLGVYEGIVSTGGVLIPLEWSSK